MKNVLITTEAFTSPRGREDPMDGYTSRFNFIWWFWLPRIHTQSPNSMNPRVIRLIWLCFAIGLNIWGKESKMYWPINLLSASKLSSTKKRSHNDAISINGNNL